MSKVFFDANIIIYANDAKDPRKQTIAMKIVSQALKDRNGVISTQVLAEYAVTALDKLHQDSDSVLQQLLLLERFEVVQLSAATIRRSIELRRLYQIHFWDASIL